VDVDAFITANRDTWERLDVLVARAQGDVRRLDAAALDELVRLHLRTSSHLSTVRTHLGDADLAAHLSVLIARSAAVVHGTRARSWRNVATAIGRTFPAAVWHLRVHVVVATVAFLGVAVVTGAWLATSPRAVDAALPEPLRTAYVEDDFEAYYSEQPAAVFGAQVFTNNARVGALAFAVGIAWGVPTLYVLALNGVNVGIAAGVFHDAGEAARFYGLILPHGLLELTAVFIAGGTGLALGWTLIAPGDRLRRDALAEQGRRAIVVVVGLVLVFAVSGVLEAYVTPAAVPTWLRVTTGAVVWAAFCAWIVVMGRRAAAAGLTGRYGEELEQHLDPPLRAHPGT
jgi:uncharacterized membrane protein SpoIIM required for sporulation